MSRWRACGDPRLRNSGRRQAEADLVMPLPGQAAVTNLGLWIDGRRVEAQLLTADEALQAYTDIVRQRLDPALLEYAGEARCERACSCAT